MHFVNKGPRLEGCPRVPHGETLAASLREEEKEAQRADQLVRGPTGLHASVQPRRTSCYMTTGKTIALTRWTFVGKVTSLLFNMLCRLVMTFLPRSKRLLISWLQSPSAVTLELKKIESVTVFIVSPSIYHEMMGSDAMILVF